MQKTEMSFFRDKRILITGHTGFKGSWLSRILIDAGAKVTGAKISASSPAIPSLNMPALPSILGWRSICSSLSMPVN